MIRRRNNLVRLIEMSGVAQTPDSQQQTAEFFKENVDCVVYKFTTINTKNLIINEASRAKRTRTLLQGIRANFTYPRTDERASKITFRDRLSFPGARSLPKLDPDGFLSSSKRVGAGGKWNQGGQLRFYATGLDVEPGYGKRVSVLPTIR
jgi:hypothetical protein